MVKFNSVEKVQERVAGEYLFKIYEVNEKTSAAGNEYWQVKFETADGFKVCDNFMFSGKAANKTLGLLFGIGIGDGETWENLDPTVDDLLGAYVHINVKKQKDGDFFECPWGKSGYRAFDGAKKSEPKKEVAAAPF